MLLLVPLGLCCELLLKCPLNAVALLCHLLSGTFHIYNYYMYLMWCYMLKPVTNFKGQVACRNMCMIVTMLHNTKIPIPLFILLIIECQSMHQSYVNYFNLPIVLRVIQKSQCFKNYTLPHICNYFMIQVDINGHLPLQLTQHGSPSWQFFILQFFRF